MYVRLSNERTQRQPFVTPSFVVLDWGVMGRPDGDLHQDKLETDKLIVHLILHLLHAHVDDQEGINGRKVDCVKHILMKYN